MTNLERGIVPILVIALIMYYRYGRYDLESKIRSKYKDESSKLRRIRGWLVFLFIVSSILLWRYGIVNGYWLPPLASDSYVPDCFPKF